MAATVTSYTECCSTTAASGTFFRLVMDLFAGVLSFPPKYSRIIVAPAEITIPMPSSIPLPLRAKAVIDDESDLNSRDTWGWIVFIIFLSPLLFALLAMFFIYNEDALYLHLLEPRMR